MFDKISEKLKTIANVLFRIAVVLAGIMCIAGLAFLSEASGATVGMLIGAAVVLGGSYVSSALIYAFAELLEKTTSINLHIGNISSNGIPRLIKNTEKDTTATKESEIK